MPQHFVFVVLKGEHLLHKVGMKVRIGERARAPRIPFDGTLVGWRWWELGMGWLRGRAADFCLSGDWLLR